ncbi:MAG: hypothetical protein P8H25_03420 [Flavobacteriaceae bacterium]|nr:hypothetical protein [Flavobacteriaceae bacterium]
MKNLRRIPSTHRRQPSIKATFVFEGEAPVLFGLNLKGSNRAEYSDFKTISVSLGLHFFDTPR